MSSFFENWNRQKLKILIINYEFPPIGGGAGNASYYIARELSKLKHEVRVVTAAFGDLPRVEHHLGFDIVRIPAWRKRIERCSILEMTSFLVSGLWHVSMHKEYRHFDKVLAFFTVPCAPMAFYMKVRWKIPYVTLLRGGDVPGFKGIGKLAATAHFFLRPLIRFLWRQSDAVVANSKGLAALAKQTLNMTISVIPNGVDTEFFKPRDWKKDITGSIQMLFVGRLSIQKGILPFLRFLETTHGYPEWHLKVVGEGPLGALLKSIVAQSKILVDRVTFTGWLSREQLVTVYQASDIFVFPTLDEGMPNAVLEAMACGLPVLATNVAGNEDLVIDNENGYTFQIDDYQSASTPLTALINESHLRNKFARVSVKMASRYSWASTAVNITKLIDFPILK